jgi:hypothetical protein
MTRFSSSHSAVGGRPTAILWWDGPEFNARHFEHPGCAAWVVPQDRMDPPTGGCECPECISFLPVRAAVDVPEDERLHP